jgi:hypothetical protein
MILTSFVGIRGSLGQDSSRPKTNDISPMKQSTSWTNYCATTTKIDSLLAKHRHIPTLVCLHHNRLIQGVLTCLSQNQYGRPPTEHRTQTSHDRCMSKVPTQTLIVVCFLCSRMSCFLHHEFPSESGHKERTRGCPRTLQGRQNRNYGNASPRFDVPIRSTS